tara:strand:+ start:5081 stop:5794 length:714 start_codon:yes stop_codon:yes gene_type:complete
MIRPFEFKQFTICQDRCAMKIGTDGVLLGAWASLENDPDSILDIGAGTGVIALMLAQRSLAETVDAIEIEEAAYEQCVENFEASPWADRLFCYHAGLDELVDSIEEPYDLIVSNPPFYTEEVSSGDGARDRARQNRSLPFEELVESVPKLLAPDGIFTTIIPYKAEDAFVLSAIHHGLFPSRITRVKGNPTSAVKRSLLEFRLEESDIATSILIIEEGRHHYTDDYIALTKDFYKKM